MSLQILTLHAAAALFVGVMVAGCDRKVSKPSAPPLAAPDWFADVTSQQGVNFIHDSGSQGRYFMPEHIGSGVAVFDANGDGRQDLYFVQNAGIWGPKNSLFLQHEIGHFRDASAGSGLDVAGRGMGTIAGDVNNDGLLDVLLTEYGGARLFLNLGNGKFTEITSECGIDAPRWATAASFLDYDRDGWLDVVIGQYVDFPPSEECFDAKGVMDFCGPTDFPGTSARLFRNLGRSGLTPAFEDTTVRSGIVRVPGPALGILCADFDGDRWTDVLLADDGAANRLFVNQRNGTFLEEAAVRGVALDGNGAMAANMGIAGNDVSGDGLFDILITHLDSETHGLWVQGPRGIFSEQGAIAGVAASAWRGTGFGTAFADFNHDGLVDLAIVNGAVDRRQPSAQSISPIAGLAPFWTPYAQRAQLFTGEPGGRLRDISEQSPVFCGSGMVGRGLALADLDNDGAFDLVATSAGGPARLFRNVAPNRGHWMTVRTVDPALGGRDAIGAEILVEAGGHKWHRLVQPSQSFLSSHDVRAHFGLGGLDAVESIRVIWPDGVEERFDGRQADAHIILRKGEGRERTKLTELPQKTSPQIAKATQPTGKRSAHHAAKPAPGSRQWLIDGATELLAGRKLEDAARLIERLINEHGSHPKSWLLRGRLQLLTGDAAGAQLALQRHVELAPNSEQGHFQIGLALLRLARLAEAEAAFRRAVGIKHDYTAAHFNRATVLLRLGRKEDAALAFRDVIRFSPETLEAYLRLASLKLEAGDKDSATKFLSEASYLAPNDPRLKGLMERASAP